MQQVYFGRFLLVSLITPFIVLGIGLILHRVAMGWQMDDLETRKYFESKVHILTFHQNEFEKSLKWKHPREFEMEGIMYDVLKKEDCKDSVKLICVVDHKESFLLHKIKEHLGIKLVTQHGQNNSSSKDQKLIKINYFIQQESKWLAARWDVGNFVCKKFYKPSDFLFPCFHPPEFS